MSQGRIYRIQQMLKDRKVVPLRTFLAELEVSRATFKRDLSILRERNPTFVRLSDGSIRNAYTVKVQNHNNAARTFQLAVDGPKNLDIKVVGTTETFDVEGDKLRAIRVLLTVPASSITAESMPVTFKVSDPKSHESTASNSVFLSDGATP